MSDEVEVVNERKRVERDKRKQEIADLRWLMGQPMGRRFMWRLLDKSGMYRTSFTGNSSTFFNEGMRNIGLWALADVMEACPDQFSTMTQENRKDQPNG